MSTSAKQILWVLVRFAILGCSVAAGCGGDENSTASTTTGDSTGVTAEEWKGYCDDRAILQCSNFDTAVCMEQQTCARAFLRNEIEAPILECLRGTCGWESCLGKTSDVPRSGVGEAFFYACAERTTACGLGGDSCFAGDLVTDAEIGKLDACLDLASCADTDACMSNYGTMLFETCMAWH